MTDASHFDKQSTRLLREPLVTSQTRGHVRFQTSFQTSTNRSGGTYMSEQRVRSNRPGYHATHFSRGRTSSELPRPTPSIST